MSASSVISALKTTLTNLLHEDGVTRLGTIWEYPPEDPATGNFPALAIEMAPDVDFEITPAPFQPANTGQSNDTYTLNLCLFVGAPAAGNLGELHGRAIGWRVPLYQALQANLSLSGTAAVIGDPRSGEFELRGRVGGITWNGAPLYGVTFFVQITEFV